MSVAMLVTPATTARLVTDDVGRMSIVGVGIGIGIAMVGFVVAYHLNASPGAVIALCGAAAFAVIYAATLPRRMRHHARFS
jgi:manganese/iron transport system permease protein